MSGQAVEQVPPSWNVEHCRTYERFKTFQNFMLYLPGAYFHRVSLFVCFFVCSFMFMILFGVYGIRILMGALRHCSNFRIE